MHPHTTLGARPVLHELRHNSALANNAQQMQQHHPKQQGPKRRSPPASSPRPTKVTFFAFCATHERGTRRAAPPALRRPAIVRARGRCGTGVALAWVGGACERRRCASLRRAVGWCSGLWRVGGGVHARARGYCSRCCCGNGRGVTCRGVRRLRGPHSRTRLFGGPVWGARGGLRQRRCGLPFVGCVCVCLCNYFRQPTVLIRI